MVPNNQSHTRMSYDVSCRILFDQGWIDDPSPALPHAVPAFDDDTPLGVSFFRTEVTEASFENLTLSRTYIARCELRKVSFRNSDLHESRFNWNDFDEIDFTNTDLSNADLRTTNFARSRFISTNLTRSDLRGCSLKDCDFTNAIMTGTKLTMAAAARLNLSFEQRRSIEWHKGDGPVPAGG